jgi:hypothetical protein
MGDGLRDVIIVSFGLAVTASLVAPGRKVREDPEAWPKPLWRQTRTVCPPGGACRVEILEGHRAHPFALAASLRSRVAKEKGWTSITQASGRSYFTRGLGPGAPRFTVEPWAIAARRREAPEDSRTVSVVSEVRPATAVEAAVARLRP